MSKNKSLDGIDSARRSAFVRVTRREDISR